MEENRLKNKDFESTNFIVFLWKWKYTLLIVTLAAAITAAIFSAPMFITPKYEAKVVMFPSSTSSISKSLISEHRGTAKDIMEFGEEEQAEQMLQILNSNRIQNKVIEKYNLLDHYDIKPDAKYKQTRLYEEYGDNINFKRTEYMAIEIKVLDKDPQMAADIANDISRLYDSVKTSMQRQRAYKAYRLVEQEYHELKNEVESKEDSLNKLRTLGIHDYESQSERLTEELAKQLAKGNQPAINRLSEKLDVLGKYGGAYVSIRDELEFEKKELSRIKTKYEEAKMDAHANLPHKFVVEEAYPPERKTYPIRWLIVVVSALAAFILSLMVIIIMQTIRNLNEQPKHSKRA
ncbi:MAG: Wzz/FepE/Etk N-terminal domain-containing protein [Bacteroidales bacterium]